MIVIVAKKFAAYSLKIYVSPERMRIFIRLICSYGNYKQKCHLNSYVGAPLLGLAKYICYLLPTWQKKVMEVLSTKSISR